MLTGIEDWFVATESTERTEPRPTPCGLCVFPPPLNNVLSSLVGRQEGEGRGNQRFVGGVGPSVSSVGSVADLC